MNYRPWTRAGQGYRSTYSPRLAMMRSSLCQKPPAHQADQQQFDFSLRETTKRRAMERDVCLAGLS